MTTESRHVAMIVADGFEDSEATSPIEALAEKGVTVTVIGPETGTVTGKKGATVEAVATITDSTVSDFEFLIVPGGTAPAKLREMREAVDFARGFVDSGKPVASICHGPQLLVTADVIQGRTLTAVGDVQEEIEGAGATFVDEEVHVDGNLISSRTPDDLPAFNAAIIDALGL